MAASEVDFRYCRDAALTVGTFAEICRNDVASVFVC